MLLQLPAGLGGADPSPLPLTPDSAAPPFFNSTGWQVFAAIALVIGLVAAIQQIGAYVSRRGERKVQARVFALVEAQLRAEDIREDADSAAQDAKRLEARVQELLGQIHDQIPRQAQRLHLEHRRDQLAESLAEDFAEYSTLEAELSTDSEGATTPLDASIRDSIRTAVVPAWDQRRRQDRRVAALLSMLVLLNFLPINPTGPLLWGLWVLWRPLDHSASAVASVVVGGMAVVVLMIWTVDRVTRDRSFRKRLPALTPARAPLAGIAVAVVGVSGLAVLMSAATVVHSELHYDSFGRYSQSEQAGVGTMLLLGILGVGTAFYLSVTAVVMARRRMRMARDNHRLAQEYDPDPLSDPDDVG